MFLPPPTFAPTILIRQGPKRCQRRFFTTNPLTEVPTNYVRRTNIIARGQRHRPTKKLAFLAVGNAVKEEG